MKTRIANYFKAAYPALYFISHEEARIEALIAAACAQADRASLYVWSLTDGRLCIADNTTADLDHIAVLKSVADLPPNSVLVLRDFHLLLTDSQGNADPMTCRAFKDAISEGKAKGVTICVIGALLRLPVELAKLITVIDFALPDRSTLTEVLAGICENNEIPMPDGDLLSTLLDASSGLTTTEAEDAFSLSYIETGTLCPEVVRREKSYTIKKNGILTLVEDTVTLDDIGGLELYKEDLLEKRNRFTPAAKAYGIPSPRGTLAVGQPGTGKSLTAVATRTILGIPLLRLKAAHLFGSLLGETEQNWKNVFATAKAIAPCILWIDEVDGLFAGSESSGKTDGGATARVTKDIIQDMEDAEGIFFMFTANDIDCIPDPVIDRLDEVWNVELPNASEREAIWRIQISKTNREPSNFDLPAIASASEGFSGRQIRASWLKAMGRAFSDGEREATTEDVIAVAKSTVPTSVTMSTQIETRRKRLASRAKPASRTEPSAPASTPRINGKRKLSV